jgi:hypothetical protein
MYYTYCCETLVSEMPITCMHFFVQLWFTPYITEITPAPILLSKFTSTVCTVLPVTLICRLYDSVYYSMATILVGGYLLPMADAHKFAKEVLEIPDPTTHPRRLEWSINNWIAEHPELPNQEFKSAVLSWPRDNPNTTESAVLFVSKKKVQDGSKDRVEEGEEDRKIKVWLVKMGVGEGKLEWESVVDNCSITLLGLKARKSDTKFGGQVSADEMMGPILKRLEELKKGRGSES